MSLFFLQLLISFVVGGGFIALLSFLSERASQKMAGLLIALPSTGALSYLFISWTSGPATIPVVAPVTLVSMGSIIFFTITYLALSKIALAKWASMATAMLGALFVWLMVAMLLKQFHFVDLWAGVFIYLLSCLVGYYFLTHLHKKETPQRYLQYTLAQKLFRAVFAGGVIALAVYLSKTLDPFWGGLFAGYPAAFTSTLLILHWHHDADFLARVFRNAPIGFISPPFFILFADFTFPILGTGLGFLVSYIGAILIFIGISRLVKA